MVRSILKIGIQDIDYNYSIGIKLFKWMVVFAQQAKRKENEAINKITRYLSSIYCRLCQTKQWCNKGRIESYDNVCKSQNSIYKFIPPVPFLPKLTLWLNNTLDIYLKGYCQEICFSWCLYCSCNNILS